MKQRLLSLLMALAMAGYLFTGCASVDGPQTPSEEPTPVPETASPEPEQEVPFSFADVENLTFWFGSGAGAWSTELRVHADGTFEGEYSDRDLDIQYLCRFTGAFTEPVKVDGYTYSVQLKQIELEQKAGTQESKDGITYIYSTPYGLEDADEFLFYLPGTPVESLSEDCLSWMKRYGDFIDKELPFYGFYNVKAEQGFSSHKTSTIDDTLEQLEQEDALLKEQLETNASLSQAEINVIAQERYELWDDGLNLIWGQLKEELEPAAMDTLTVEEREWIAHKEAEMEKAGSEVEGGSLQPVFVYGKGRELTRTRVYELAAYLR